MGLPLWGGCGEIRARGLGQWRGVGVEKSERGDSGSGVRNVPRRVLAGDDDVMKTADAPLPPSTVEISVGEGRAVTRKAYGAGSGLAPGEQPFGPFNPGQAPGVRQAKRAMAALGCQPNTPIFFFWTPWHLVCTSLVQVYIRYYLLVKTSPTKLFQQCIRWLKFARCICVTTSS